MTKNLEYASVLNHLGITPPGWKIDNPLTQGWTVATPLNQTTPHQGWKLHISATPSTAMQCLKQVVPILHAHRSKFKTVRDSNRLAMINSGSDGISQVGKFITIYPRDDHEAVELATVIAKETRRIIGPPVPSDFRIKGSRVLHYRYGAFKTMVYRDSSGEMHPAVRSQEGGLIPDIRAVPPIQPEGIPDIFEAAGLKAKPPVMPALVAGRFMLVSKLMATPRGVLFGAVDLENRQPVIVKYAQRFAGYNALGIDAVNRLEFEQYAMTCLAPSNICPKPIQYIRDAGAAYLIMTMVEGIDLGQFIKNRLSPLLFSPVSLLLRISQGLVALLKKAHTMGCLIRDLKPSNIMMLPDLSLILIDLESVYLPNHQGPAGCIRTVGYASPQQEAGMPPSPEDDIYSLGATLKFLWTGVDAYHQPSAEALRAFSCREYNPGVPGMVDRAIEMCLNPEADRRPSLQELEKSFSQ